jgi:SAM-dependent methyltransferase
MPRTTRLSELMPTSKSRKAPRRSRGMPAADRAMWTRLYAEISARRLPWANQTPFPPLLRAVQDRWLSPPGPVLDVGCGVGTNTFWLSSQGFRAMGVDLVPAAVKVAESTPWSETPRPEFRVDDVLASHLPTGQFRGAVDVGCFHTLPIKTRPDYAASLARVLSPGAALVVFWVAREERGTWGTPHRLSVGEITQTFESLFLVDRVVYRPRTVRLTPEVKRSSRPLATLAGYTARLVRRRGRQPGPM